MENNSSSLKDNIASSRFELKFNNSVVYADYNLDRNVLSLNYVFAPEELRGSGAAGKLMEEIAKMAQEKNLKIIPICSYAALWMRKHKQYHDLLL